MEIQVFTFDLNEIVTMISWSDFYRQAGIDDFIESQKEILKDEGLKPWFKITNLYMNKNDEQKLLEIQRKTWKENNIHFKRKLERYVITSKKKTPLKKLDYSTEKSFSWDKLYWGPNVSFKKVDEGKIILEWEKVDINQPIY